MKNPYYKEYTTQEIINKIDEENESLGRKKVGHFNRVKIYKLPLINKNSRPIIDIETKALDKLFLLENSDKKLSLQNNNLIINLHPDLNIDSKWVEIISEFSIEINNDLRICLYQFNF